MHSLSHGFCQHLKMNLQALLSQSAWLLTQIPSTTLQKFSPCHQKGHKLFCTPSCWSALLPWTPGKADKSLQICSLSRWHKGLLLLPTAPLYFHFQVREIPDFLICIKLLLQRRPLPFSRKCSFHLSTLSHIKVRGYCLSILIWLLLQNP